jgi:hypothetical protein
MTANNERVSLREYLISRIDALEEKMLARFAALDGKLDDKLVPLADHENRIRTLEKANPIRTVTEIITGIVAIVGVALGFRPPNP